MPGRLLAATRPTAVNLRWAIDRMLEVTQRTMPDARRLTDSLVAEAKAIHAEDRAMCEAIGEHGLAVVPDGAVVLTHCNAGSLATGGIGTALAPVYRAHQAGRRVHVIADETRPVLQGGRLTAWELTRAGMPCTLIADSMAASRLRQGRRDLRHRRRRPDRGQRRHREQDRDLSAGARGEGAQRAVLRRGAAVDLRSRHAQRRRDPHRGAPRRTRSR